MPGKIIIKKPKPGDLAGYMKYKKIIPGFPTKSGDMIPWMAIITKVKNSSVQVFDPVDNIRYYVSFTKLKALMEGIDDQGETYALLKLKYINSHA